jgi:6-pyruvoyltetrahydropterin/6-carboxytetrahydropterin synthase
MYITRRERFNAAHRLFREDFSNEENLKVFGKCSNPMWHGHNYELFVTVKGEIDPQTGFVMNLKTLSEIVNEFIISKIDHKNINLEVDFMKDKIASTEVLAQTFFEILKPQIEKHNAQLHCVKLYETENHYVEYFG